jgi:hypothetical protein
MKQQRMRRKAILQPQNATKQQQAAKQARKSERRHVLPKNFCNDHNSR